MLNRLEARQIVVGEDHASAFKFGDGSADVVHPEAYGRVLGLGALRFREKRDLGPAAAVDDLAVEPFLAGGQGQGPLVELSRSPESRTGSITVTD